MNVSLKDIADKAGISEAAVSMALRDHPRISSKRRSQVKILAQRMGYQPNLLARAMRLKRTNTVGLLVSNFQTGVTNVKAEALEQCLVERGYHVLLGFTHQEGPRLIQYVQNMLARKVDGLIIMGQYQEPALWNQAQTLIRESGTPCVLADYQDDVDGYHCLSIDRAAGIRAAAEHLWSLGHRRIFHLRSGGRTVRFNKWQGLQQWAESPAVRREGHITWSYVGEQGQRDLSEEAPVHHPVVGRVHIVEAALAKAREIAQWRQRPTAIMTTADVTAVAMIKGLQRQGLRVPGDVSVTGFDDDEVLNLLFEPRLTTVQQPREELADKTAAMLLALMEGKDVVQRWQVLTPKFIVGQSTGPAGGKQQLQENSPR